MDEKIDNAIAQVLDKFSSNTKEDQALKFSQAALNLAHVKQILGGTVPIKREILEGKIPAKK